MMLRFCRWVKLYVAVQLMKKSFALGMLVDRLRIKGESDMSSAIADKLELARENIDEAETICSQVRSLALPSSFSCHCWSPFGRSYSTD